MKYIISGLLLLTAFIFFMKAVHKKIYFEFCEDEKYENRIIRYLDIYIIFATSTLILTVAVFIINVWDNDVSNFIYKMFSYKYIPSRVGLANINAFIIAAPLLYSIYYNGGQKSREHLGILLMVVGFTLYFVPPFIFGYDLPI